MNVEDVPSVGDEVGIVVATSKGTSFTGPLVVRDVNEGGVLGARETWFGELSMFLRWDVIVGFSPPHWDLNPRHTSLCEACP